MRGSSPVPARARGGPWEGGQAVASAQGVGRETELVCPDPMAFALGVLALWDLRLTSLQGRHIQDRPSESGNRQRDCSDPQTAVVVNYRDQPG